MEQDPIDMTERDLYVDQGDILIVNLDYLVSNNCLNNYNFEYIDDFIYPLY